MLKKFLDRFILSRRKEIPFLIFFWFLLSFLVARFWIILMTNKIIPDMYLDLRGIHVHHFVYGMAIALVSGFIGLAAREFSTRHLHGLAIWFGIGLGLVFDEASLFILLQDNYWARYSYDAVIIVSLVFLNIIYFQGFWKYLVRKLPFLRKKRAASENQD